MKKRSLYSFMLAGVITLAAVLFSGCEKDMAVGTTANPITLTVADRGFEGVRAATRGAKAVTSDITTIGVSASVYGSSSTYTSAGCGSYFHNEQVTPGTPTGYFWPTSDYRLSFFAYYPYGNAALTVQSAASATGAPTYAYTVPSAIASQVDVMTAQNTDVPGGSAAAVSLTMKHRCASVSFSVTNSRSSAITLTSVSIEGVKYTGTLNEETWTLGEAVNGSSSNPFTLSYGSAIASGATANITGTTNIFLMLPQTIPAGAKVKVVIDGEDPMYADLTGSWLMGKQYNYSVDVKNNTIVIVDEDTEVANWRPCGSVDLGLPSGTLWAKGNIISDGNGGYKIGEETDYGAYFSWGNVDPHFSSNGSTFDDGYDCGTSNTGSPYAGSAGASISFTSQHKGRDYPANTTNDAARACLGGSWQVPTATQFKELYDNTDNEWTTIGGVNGRKFMKKTDHYVYVFFPAAGYSLGSELIVRGVYGYYWSSSLYSDVYGYILFIDSSSAAPQSFSPRYLGRSVRPVVVE